MMSADGTPSSATGASSRRRLTTATRSAPAPPSRTKARSTRSSGCSWRDGSACPCRSPTRWGRSSCAGWGRGRPSPRPSPASGRGGVVRTDIANHAPSPAGCRCTFAQRQSVRLLLRGLRQFLTKAFQLIVGLTLLLRRSGYPGRLFLLSYLCLGRLVSPRPPSVSLFGELPRLSQSHSVWQRQSHDQDDSQGQGCESWHGLTSCTAFEFRPGIVEADLLSTVKARPTELGSDLGRTMVGCVGRSLFLRRLDA
jgi:hypothetical protein